MDLESSKGAMLKKMMSILHVTRVLPYEVRTLDAIIPCFLENVVIRKPFMTPPRRDYISNYRVK